jgi:small subunit ribosomal protein S6
LIFEGDKYKITERVNSDVHANCAGRTCAAKTTGGVNMRDYELLFVLDPSLDEEAKAGLIEKVKEVISAGGEAGEADVWGDRKLAYNIGKKSTGYYVVLPFKADAELPKELDRRLRINENVMRHIIVCQDEE